VNGKYPIIAIGAFCYVIGFVNYFGTVPVLSNIASYVGSWSNVLGYFTLMLGTEMIFIRNITDIKRHQKKMGQTVWPFQAMSLAIIIVLVPIMIIEAPGLGIDYINAMSIYAVVSQASKALLGMFAITATYRSFRSRSLTSLVALVFVTITMFGTSNIGAMIWGTNWATMQTFINNTLMNGTYKLIMITAAIGTVLLGIRLALGRELRIYGYQEARRTPRQEAKKA